MARILGGLEGPRGAYGRVLRNRPLAKLLVGEFVSSVGDWLALVAFLIILYEQTQDPVLLGILGAARVLPYAFLSLPAGILADRVDRRLILLVTDLARGGLMLVLAWVAATGGDVTAIVVVATLSTCFSAFFGPAIGSYVPTLVKDESDLGPANASYAALDNVASILGPAIASIVLLTLGLQVAFLLNAVTFFFVAAVLWTLPSSHAGDVDWGQDEADEEVAGREVGEGADPAVPRGRDWRRVVRPLGGLMVVDLVESFVFGGLGVLTVVVAYDLLGAGEQGTGILNSAAGLGGLLGTIIAGALVLRRRLGPPLLLGAVMLGIGTLVLGLATDMGFSALAMTAAAVGSVLLGIVGDTLFQRIVPDTVRGRAIGLLETLNVLVFAAGSFAIPVAVAWFGITGVLVLFGALMVLAGVVALPLLGTWAVQAPLRDPIRSAIGSLPLFASLSPARVEEAERRAAALEVRPGEVVIRQGEEADRFYVIARGLVEVSQVDEGGAAARVLRRMGPGEGFGEIGLLTGAPRTATVTAVETTALAAIDKTTFLDLVTGTSVTFPLVDLQRGGLASAQRAAIAPPQAQREEGTAGA
jgi:MFS family permease